MTTFWRCLLENECPTCHDGLCIMAIFDSVTKNLKNALEILLG